MNEDQIAQAITEAAEKIGDEVGGSIYRLYDGGIDSHGLVSALLEIADAIKLLASAVREMKDI